MALHGVEQPNGLNSNQRVQGSSPCAPTTKSSKYRACLAAGVEPRFREILFGDYAEAAACVISANIHRRHLTAEQRRELIEKLLKADPGQSDRQIAETG